MIMTETAGPSAFGRVADDGTVYVRVGETERVVGQIPGSTPEEALAFFGRRYDGLTVDVDLLTQRIQRGALNPEEARKAVATLKSNILEANAVGDLEGLAGKLDGLTDVIDEAAKAKREDRARAAEETRQHKEALITESEQLADSTDWRGGVTRYHAMLDEWKALPRIDRATDDELWHRFSAARTAYTRRRKAHFAEVSARQDESKAKKEQIIEEARELADSTDWGATSAAFRALMDRWRAAGSASRGVDDALWAEFRGIQDQFFDRRTAVHSAQDSEFQSNLNAKLALLDSAEKEILPVKDITTARAAYREFLAHFNTLGRVPREQMRAIDARVKALESAVEDADRREWARTDPETRSRATDTINLFSSQIVKLKADLEAAEAKGDTKRAATINASLATYQSWLDQAKKTLGDLT